MGSNAAKAFIKKYELHTLNSAILQSIIESQGYTFIEFNGIDDTEEVTTLIDLLNVRPNIQSSKCFVYQDKTNRLLFINENLSEDERLIVLAHEEGHIWNNHMHSDASDYENVTQEFEANEFAHYLLKATKPRVTTFPGKRSRVALIAAVMAVVVLGAGAFGKKRYDAATYTQNLYVTESGHKYHRKDCIYIRDKNNIRKLKLVEFENGLFEPCQACFPDEQNAEPTT